MFCTFSLQNVLFATAACNFWCLLSAPSSAPAALTSLLLDWPDTRIIEKTQHFATSLTFRAYVSSFFQLSDYCIFCPLTWLLYCWAMHVLFNSPYCRKFLFKLPSTTLYYPVLQRTTLYCKVLQRTTPVLLQYHSVLQSTTPVLQSTTPVLLCTTKYYNVLLQYYSVLKSTTPVLQRTTLYYKVLQSTTPVLLCTTKYYASTTLHYKVLLQYYSVLQSTTPVPLCTTKYYASTTLYCAAQQESPSNFTKYCTCHAKWMSSMIWVTYESSFPMRGASKVSLQPHQILRLPRKMNVIDDLRHIWKLISNAWSKSSHPPTSPNTAPATQNQRHQWSASHMKRHFQCAEPVKSPSNLTKYCACHEILKVKICAGNPWSASANRKTIRP